MNPFAVRWGVSVVDVVRSTTGDVDLSEEDYLAVRTTLSGAEYEVAYTFGADDGLELVTFELLDEEAELTDSDYLRAWDSMATYAAEAFGACVKFVEDAHLTSDDRDYWTGAGIQRTPRWAVYEDGQSRAILTLQRADFGYFSFEAILRRQN